MGKKSVGADHAQEGGENPIGGCKPIPGSVLQNGKNSCAVARVVDNQDARYRESGHQLKGQERGRGRRF